jgi:DNA-binding protein H-NS
MREKLEGLSVAELEKLIADARDVRDETRERRRKELRAEIEARLKAEGFTPHEVLGAKLKPKPDTLPPKYADETGRTWSGKGRVPGWLQERIDQGDAAVGAVDVAGRERQPVALALVGVLAAHGRGGSIRVPGDGVRGSAGDDEARDRFIEVEGVRIGVVRDEAEQLQLCGLACGRRHAGAISSCGLCHANVHRDNL